MLAFAKPSGRWWIGAAGLTFACAGIFLARPSVSQAEPELLIAQTPTSAVPDVMTTPQIVGAASCAATACHGATERGGNARGSEYSRWMLGDPHLNAYTVLRNERSRTIAKNLQKRLVAGWTTLYGKAPEKFVEAHEAQVCLDCHAPRPESGDTLGFIKTHPELQLSYGLGCESCHGPASKWLSEHTTVEWKGLPLEKKEALGFINTDNLTGRARSCVQCHIGAADREVNHDLIAAGHPRLAFEFSAFHALLPHHWREFSPGQDKDKNKAFEARAWVIGQVISAQQSLKLLELRAGTPKFLDGTDRQWPEFTEYDCYACHHDLQSDSWRRKEFANWKSAGTLYRRPGDLPWGSWYLSSLSLAAGDKLPAATLDKLLQKPQADAAALAAAPATLEQLMNRPSVANKPEIAKMAKAAADELNTVLAALESMPNEDIATVKAKMTAIAGDPTKLAGSDWDHAGQTLLALQAMYHALYDLDHAEHNPTRNAALAELVKLLEFQASPNSYLDSPNNFSPDAYRNALQNVRDSLSK